MVSEKQKQFINKTKKAEKWFNELSTGMQSYYIIKLYAENKQTVKQFKEE